MSGRTTRLVAALVAATFVLLLSGAGGTSARWYKTTSQAGSLHSAGPLAITMATGSATPLITLVPSGWVYAAIPTVTDTGALTALLSVDEVTTASGGAGTDATGVTALAGRLAVGVAAVAGTTCDATTFGAGTVLLSRSPVGTNAVGLLTSTTSGLTIPKPAGRYLCARYSLSAGSLAGTWGRTLALTWKFIGNYRSWLSPPVSWQHSVRMYIPAPLTPTGTGAPAVCTVERPLGVPTKVTIRWGWPTSADWTGGNNPQSFGLTTNTTPQTDRPANDRVLVVEGSLLTTILGSLLGSSVDFIITAKAGDAVSAPLTVRLTLGALGIFQSCAVV